MNNTNTTCPICYENIENKNTSTTKCGHIFHTDCLLKSIKYSHKFKCPWCRNDIINDVSPPPDECSEECMELVNILNTLIRKALNPHQGMDKQSKEFLKKYDSDKYKLFYGKK